MNSQIIRTFVFGLLAVALLVLLGVFRVWQNYQVVETGTLRGIADERVHKLERENEVLRTQYEANRGIPATLGRIAEQAGMRHPTEADIIRLAPPKETIHFERNAK